MEKNNKKITSRDVDFAKWYNDIISEADLVDYSSVKGSMIIRPYGYAIWESMVSVLDKMFKDTGHVNVQMPMFIPESLFNIEKDHVEGFAPEVAWVTRGGSEKLEERMLVRPTSEVLFCEHYKKIIKSYRDLPLLYNQWCTIVRWEKTTRPFLRSREILWQEGHTMHETEKEAREETLRMLNVYTDFQKKYLAIPVIPGRKTDKEKFAGAEETYTVEAMMYDGVALQNGTSHYFGQGFAKAFDIKFLNQKNLLENPYQTSWGVTTRMIGGLIMVHSDNLGLVLPPNIAPIKIGIIPIGDNKEVKNLILNLEKALTNANITYHTDNTDRSPGFKFAEAEVKGYPIRIEVGARDLKENKITLVRRDTLEKITSNTNIEDIIKEINNLLNLIQSNLYNKAEIRRNSMLYKAKDLKEFEKYSDKPGFILTSWCGTEECEESVKENYGLKSRCLPLDDETSDKPCTICQKKGKYKLYYGKQY
ncbi:MAG: proline--tRNA ligase [Bacilli bacterium]|nr:proline--tRNA ligase [Bacilli bacterium]